MKKLSSLIISFIFLTTLCTAQVSKTSSSSLLGSGETFHLSWFTDGIVLGGATALVGTDVLCSKVLKLNRIDVPDEFNKGNITMLDQIFMNPYSKGLDYTATGLEFALLASPLCLITTDKSEWFTIGTMYVESMLWALGIKEFGKFAVNRARPYMYFDNPPQKYIDDYDWAASFPSGHTTYCFTAATFTTYVFSMYNPDSKYKWIVGTTCYTIAATVGGLRMASGNHFLSDVMTGALIGTVCGFVVPYVHTLYPKKQNDTFQISASPMNLNVCVKF